MNNMNMERMMQYHQNLYNLHNCLAYQYYQLAQIQLQIAYTNQEMYLHMMNQTNDKTQ
ncbi:hypothetical protein [Garciella nitratireducens]|uniref:hypothetical protein n=1 Tax=Garciella nitratireducens TaxID=218205 RepID=UPI000DFC01CF|nr:hypothetical protein [Garciella nitratireducens]RBP40283.1 hypothetical protein DFR81_11346 [Garciella nitratireducens]